MVNQIAPSAIIFINNDLSDQVKSVIQRQLFINDTMDGYEFDARLIVDPNYVQEIHSYGLRVLVIRPFNDYTNRDKADLVIFCKNGLASVLKTGVGPPAIIYPINSCYLSQIFNTNN